MMKVGAMMIKMVMVKMRMMMKVMGTKMIKVVMMLKMMLMKVDSYNDEDGDCVI